MKLIGLRKKRKNLYRSISFLLVLIMVFTYMPLTSFAGDQPEQVEDSISENITNEDTNDTDSVSGDDAGEDVPDAPDDATGDDDISDNISDNIVREDTENDDSVSGNTISDNTAEEIFETPDTVEPVGDSIFTYTEDENGDRIYSGGDCDFVVTVDMPEDLTEFEGDVSFYTMSEGQGVLYIYTTSPVTVSMKDGVTVTDQSIRVGYSSHGIHDGAHITLDNVRIDMSESMPYINASDYAFQDRADYLTRFAAFSYIGEDRSTSGVTVALIGDNELIGPSKAHENSEYKDTYGIYVEAGFGLGIKGDGNLKVLGDSNSDEENNGKSIYVDHGSLRIEGTGYFDFGSDAGSVYSKEKACICGGTYAIGNPSDLTVYGCRMCGDRYGDENFGLYIMGFTNDQNDYGKYNVFVKMDETAKAMLSDYIGRSALYEMNEDYGHAYDAVYAAACSYNGGSSLEVQYHINYGFGMDESGMIRNAIVNDHPEFIWLWDSAWSGSSRGVELVLADPWTKEELTKRTKDFGQGVNELLWKAGITETMTDYQKAYALYQVLIAHVVYDLDNDDQGAYEAIVEKKAVCAGYAKAYVYLLQRAGIQASYVPGYAIPAGASYSDGHAWIIAKIDGVYYHSDPTWDDNGSYTSFKYFNVPWSSLSSDHWTDELGYNLPEAVSPKPSLPTNLVTVTASSAAGGKAYPSGLKVPSGSDVAVTIIPDDGNILDTIRVNGVVRDLPEPDGDGIYTVVLSNVMANTTVTVTYKEQDIIYGPAVEVDDFVLCSNDGTELGEFDYYTWDNNGKILTIATATPITIKMKDGIESTTTRISLGDNCNVTIEDLHIDNAGNTSGRALIDAGYNKVNLTLKGENILYDSVGTQVGIGVNAGMSYSYYNGSELIISGNGSLKMQNLEYGICFNDITIKDGYFGFDNNYANVAFPSGSIYEIKGGYFSEANISNNTVFGSYELSFSRYYGGIPVADGCKVISSGNADYPYMVNGGESGGSDPVADVKVSSLSLDKTSCTLYLRREGDTETKDSVALTEIIKTANATNKILIWSSSDESVATVDSSGYVTAVAPGTAVIKASSTDGSNKSAICKVTVKAQQATGIYIMCQGSIVSSVTIETGDSRVLDVLFDPTDTYYKNVTWTTSDSNVAKVDDNGTLHTYADGKVTITATTTDGSNKNATLTVIARTAATGLTITGSGVEDDKVTLSNGNSLQLTASVMPDNATDKSVTWSSSNTAVAYVSSTGLVKAKGTGTAVITATTNDGSGVSASITVTVFTQGFSIDADGNTTYVKSDNTLATGWTTVGRRTYYFDPETSYMRTRWDILDGNKYYFNPETGALQTGWHTIDDELYYFNPYANGDVHSGAMVTGEFTYRGKTYFLDETTGAAVIGWRTVGDNCYYYDATGAMVSGLVSLGDGDYFFAANGTLVKNDFVEIDESVYYFDNDGKKVLGDDDYREINGERFYFDPEGKVKSGWVDTDPSSEEKLVYCFETSGDNYVFGQVAVGLAEIKGNLYLFNETTSGYYYGEMMTGMQEYNNEWYMFGSDGIAVSGWQSDDGDIYYFDSDMKVAARGMTVINKKTYYFNADGNEKPALIVNDTVKIDGYDYIADAKGVLKSIDNTSTWVDDGNKKIFLSKNGTAVSGWVADGGLMYYCDPATGEAVTGLKKIGLKVYLFDDDGALATPDRGTAIIDDVQYDLSGEITIEVDGENRQYKIRGDGSLVTGWVRDNGWKYIPSPVAATGCQTGYPSYTDALGAAALSSDMASSNTLDMANIAPVSYMESVNIAVIIPTHLKAHSLKSMMF